MTKKQPDMIRTPEQHRMALRKLVKLFYDFQRLRIQAAGRSLSARVVDDETADEEVDSTDARSVIALHPEDVQRLATHADMLGSLEKQVLKDIEQLLWADSFYEKVLSDKKRFKGIGPTMAGVILSSFDIENEHMVSQMWSFAGLAPVPAIRCKKCHSVVQETDTQQFHPKASPTVKCALAGSPMTLEQCYNSGKTMRPVKGEKLPYNAWLRTKLVGVLAPILLKCNSPYRVHYDNYKNRKIQAGWGRNDGHRHNAALRYMIKMLLMDIHIAWRTHLGLSVRKPYAEEYLNRTHHG